MRFCIWVRGIPKHINRWVGWNQPSGGFSGIDKKLNMRLQCALAQKAICILDCIKNMVSRVREVILPFCFALMRPHLQYFIQLWGSQHKKNMERWSESKGQAEGLLGAWSTSSTQRGWESWGCSDWRRKSSRRPYSNFPAIKGVLPEKWGGTFYNVI